MDSPDPLVSSMRQAVQAAPSDIPLRRHLASLLAEHGVLDEAIQHAAAALHAGPTDELSRELMRELLTQTAPAAVSGTPSPAGLPQAGLPPSVPAGPSHPSHPSHAGLPVAASRPVEDDPAAARPGLGRIVAAPHPGTSPARRPVARAYGTVGPARRPGAPPPDEAGPEAGPEAAASRAARAGYPVGGAATDPGGDTVDFAALGPAGAILLAQEAVAERVARIAAETEASRLGLGDAAFREGAAEEGAAREGATGESATGEGAAWEGTVGAGAVGSAALGGTALDDLAARALGPLDARPTSAATSPAGPLGRARSAGAGAPADPDPTFVPDLRWALAGGSGTPPHPDPATTTRPTREEGDPGPGTRDATPAASPGTSPATARGTSPAADAGAAGADPLPADPLPADPLPAGRRRRAQGGLPWDVEQVSVTLADVGGMGPAKERLEAVMLAPVRFPQLRRLYRQSLTGGVLIYGPPGCGKSFLARAVAGELGARYVEVRVRDIVEPATGTDSGDLRAILQVAHEVAHEQAPVLVVLDDIEVLSLRRDTNEHAARAIERIIEELDSGDLLNSGVHLIATTCAPWDVHAALRREGRLSRSLFVSPPDQAARESILRHELARVGGSGVDAHGAPSSAGVDLSLTEVSLRTEGYSCTDLEWLCALAASAAAKTGQPLSEEHLRGIVRRIPPSTPDWLREAAVVARDEPHDGMYSSLREYLRARRLA